MKGVGHDVARNTIKSILQDAAFVRVSTDAWAGDGWLLAAAARGMSESSKRATRQVRGSALMGERQEWCSRRPQSRRRLPTSSGSAGTIRFITFTR